MSNFDELVKATVSTLVGKISSEVLQIDSSKLMDVSEFTNSLLKQIKSDEYSNSFKKDCTIFIELEIETHISGEKELFSKNLLIDYHRSGKVFKENFIKVDFKGNVLTKEGNLINNIEELVDLSTSNKNKIYYVIDGFSLQVYINGRLKKIIGNIFLQDKAIQYKYQVPIEDYRSIINKHNKEILVGQRGVHYWENKSKRKLRSSPEEIFRSSLALYMEDHVANGFVDEEASNNNTDDRCDIIVRHISKRKDYLFELKWLGKSAGSSWETESEVQMQVNSGVEQVLEYIERNDNCCNALLLIYDARTESEDYIFEGKEEWDERVDKNPMFIYLVSKSASELGKDRQRKN